MNKPIKYSLAKLLKEKRFDIAVEYYFDISNVFTSNKQSLSEVYKQNWNNKYSDRKCTKKEFVSAPTIADVVMWLLEKHRIWIEVSFHKEEATFQWKINDSPGRFKEITPERAYETAIEHVLNNLI